MKLYPEMFISPWHLIVVVLVIIAFTALVIGKYDKRTILKSTGISALVIYFCVTIPIGLIVHESSYKEEMMLDELNQEHASPVHKLNAESNDEVYITVGAFKDEESAHVLVYAGNYSNTTFDGDLEVVVFDQEMNTVFSETYEGIHLKPGAQKEIDEIYTSQPMQTFRYSYTTQP